MKVKSESEVAQLCPTPSNPMDYNLPVSSVHGIFQARVLEWESMPKGKDYPLQYSNLENSGLYTVHGVVKSWTGLKDFHLSLNRGLNPGLSD